MEFQTLARLQHSDSAAAGAQVDTYIGTVDNYYEVVEVRLNHRVNGGANAAVDIKKAPSGTAISAGVSVMATAFDLTTGAATPQRRVNTTLSATRANRLLAPGDSLGLDYSGTLTGLLGVGVQVLLRPLRRSSL
jgi:hypothetical protein